MERTNEAHKSGRAARQLSRSHTLLSSARTLTKDAWRMVDAALATDREWDRMSASIAAKSAHLAEVATAKMALKLANDELPSISDLDAVVELWRKCKSQAAAAGVDVEWDEGDEQ